MRHSLPIAPQFYVTAPQPCPYLRDRMERKLFTSLQGDSADRLNNSLSKQGFRRSQNVLYRPSCAEYALFRDYLDSRHATGGMADMDLFEFAAMVEETPIRTRLIEYRDIHHTTTDDPYEGLRAVCLTDVLDDGVSMVYSFFAPERLKNSLGTHLILDHVNIARELNLPYVYLGYWVPGSDKMGYKANFKGVEVFRDGAWETLIDQDDYSNELNPMSVAPIAEQVSQIALPDSQS